MTNLADGTVQGRDILLLAGAEVLNGGFENGDFSDWTLVGGTQGGGGITNGVVSILEGFGDCVHSGNYAAFFGEPGFLAELSQTVPTTPGQPYLLSLWLINSLGAVPNHFVVSWDGASLFDQTNLALLSWTNLQFVVSSAATNALLQFGASNPNDGFGLDDITLTPVPAPSFQSVALSPGGTLLSWSAQAGLGYQLQYTPTLASGAWLNLGDVITATNETVTATDPAAWPATLLPPATFALIFQRRHAPRLT